jgi:CHAD domain-containing protein
MGSNEATEHTKIKFAFHRQPRLREHRRWRQNALSELYNSFGVSAATRGYCMAFRFRLGEPFDEGCRRIAVEQIERAQILLHGKRDHAVAVHETRKSLKRLRALLRLVRPALGEDVFKSETGQLREIGLSLSGARDRHVLLETVNKLEASARFGRRNLVETLRETIAAANGEGAPLTMKQADARLAEAKKRLHGLHLVGDGFEVVGPGLERSYRRARRAFAEAYGEPTDEAFHEWRKGAQAHWRQMTLLSRAWPDYLGARAAEARILSQILGDDHDLAMLVTFVHSDAAAGLRGEQAALIERAARQRQTELRASAKPRGERLFAASPRRLQRSVGIYWDAATALKEHELDQTGGAKAAQSAKRLRRQSAPRQRSAAQAKV